MKYLLLLSFFTFACFSASAQLPRFLQGKVQYPVIDIDPYVGVVDTEVEVMQYDKKLDYKVVIDVYDEVKDSVDLLNALRESARTYNLMVANGTPQDKIKMAVVVHGFAVSAILTNDAYNRQFGIDNPNIPLLKSLKENGVELYVCGQNLGFMRIPRADVVPEVKVALSAKTTFISLDQMGYTYLNVNED